ncbi:MAG: hypothetical protein ABI679_00455 [Gemmatimonadota bacterium]
MTLPRIVVFALAFLTMTCDRPKPGTRDNASLYTSPTTGFSFTLPVAWAGHYRVERPDPAGNLPPAIDVVEFVYPPIDSTIAPQVVFRVVVFTREQWDKLNAEAGPPYGWELGQKEGKVWVGGLPQSNPFVPGSADADQFDQMQISESQVSAGFHLP